MPSIDFIFVICGSMKERWSRNGISIIRATIT